MSVITRLTRFNVFRHCHSFKQLQAPSVTSIRLIRGRSKVEYESGNESSFNENEHFDEEADFSHHRDILREQFLQQEAITSNRRTRYNQAIYKDLPKKSTVFERATLKENASDFYRDFGDKTEKRYDKNYNKIDKNKYFEDKFQKKRKNFVRPYDPDPVDEEEMRHEFGTNRINKDYTMRKFRSKFEGEEQKTRRLPFGKEALQRKKREYLTMHDQMEFENYRRQNEKEGSEEVEEKKEKKKRVFFPIPYDVTAENRFEILNHILNSYHLVKYEKQLAVKFNEMKDLLVQFGKKLSGLNAHVERDKQGLPCPVEFTKASPLTTQYRNKDEFSIWPGYDGNRKTVGFFIGEPSRHNNVVCVEPEKLIFVRDDHKSLAAKFQKYLREVSPYDSCVSYDEGGNWRRFVVRSNNQGQHMCIAVMHPQQLTEENLNEEKNRIREYFENDRRIHSFYFQAAPYTRATEEQAPFQLIFGNPCFKEALCGTEFQISPGSFFQVNTGAAEVLYSNILEQCNLTPQTTLLDICCGTGALSIIASQNIKRAIGIEISSSSIRDAQQNARLNNANNCEFLKGEANKILPKILDDIYAEDVVVVANPTKAGFGPAVIDMIRQSSYIQKVVYVSCKPDGPAIKNFLHLCVPPGRTQQHLGSPFIPTNAIPVDLFPHTPHCELIMTFERFLV